MNKKEVHEHNIMVRIYSGNPNCDELIMEFPYIHPNIETVDMSSVTGGVGKKSIKTPVESITSQSGKFLEKL